MHSLKEKKQFVDNVRAQWKSMWRQRIDDRVCAEGIADQDYSLLFMERGTVIRATRKFRPPDFWEILQQHKGVELYSAVAPGPCVGGWGKYIRTVLKRQPRVGRPRRQKRLEPVGKVRQQVRKGGRGWLHQL